MTYRDAALVNGTDLNRARSELGVGFGRILGYFREDGSKSVLAIEDAMRNGNAAALVLPAHTLKGESRQFGAERLSLMAEMIETVARRCVEYRESADEIIEVVAALRGCFSETMAALERDSAPVAQRRPVAFGRRAEPASFGRA